MRANGGFGRRVVATATPAPAMAIRRAAAPAAMAVEDDQPQEAVHLGGPLLTSALLMMMIAVFWAEQHYPASPAKGLDPSLRTIVALGGLSRELAFTKGEWWRLFTAPFMHGGLSHIVGNGIAFFFAALNLEKMVGRRWLAALFFAGALGGVTGSLILNPPAMVTVGASGAIMALLAALIVLSLDSQVVKNPARIQKIALFLLIPSLAPAADGHIDIAAHLGGTIVGIVIGFFIQITWVEEAETPSFKNLALGIGAAGLAATLFGFQMVAMHFGQSSASAASIPELQLMSEEDFPTDPAEADKKSSEYVSKFPDDPRAHFFRAIYYMRGYDMTSAQGELRTALDKRELVAQLPSSFATTLHIMLAATIAQQGRIDDAQREAGPFCSEGGNMDALSDIMEHLRRMKVCPGED